MNRKFATALLLSGLLGACASSPPPVVDTISAAPTTLASGDVLDITVFGQDQMSGERMIDDSGEVTVPLVGRVKVAGMTPSQAESTLRDRISGRVVVNPSVSVEVARYRPVYVIGEVTKPGAYDWVSGMRTVNAIALAGGYTYRARADRLVVRRAADGSQESVAANEAMRLAPGDVVVVPERWF